MIVFGIDPGSAKGSVAWVGASGDAAVIDLPLIDGALDPHALTTFLRSAPVTPAAVYVERVAAMPKQGVASTFKFGRAVGAIHATVQLCGFRLELVTPGKWKAHHRLGRDKEAARALAIRLWPKLADRLARKKDADRAEALLIAEYGRTQASLLATAGSVAQSSAETFTCETMAESAADGGQPNGAIIPPISKRTANSP